MSLEFLQDDIVYSRRGTYFLRWMYKNLGEHVVLLCQCSLTIDWPLFLRTKHTVSPVKRFAYRPGGQAIWDPGERFVCLVISFALVFSFFGLPALWSVED